MAHNSDSTNKASSSTDKKSYHTPDDSYVRPDPTYFSAMSLESQRSSDICKLAGQRVPAGSSLYMSSEVFVKAQRLDQSSKISQAESEELHKEESKIKPEVLQALSEEQLEEFRKIFGFFDANNDGKISVLEISRVVGMLGQEATKAELLGMISQLDENENGYIEFDELVNALGPFYDELMNYSKENPEDLFDALDVDQDGFITAKDMVRMLRKTGDAITEVEAQQMIDAVDIKGDGKLDYDEFCLMMKSL